MNTHQFIYGASILLTGLLAGLLFGYQCSVINGLSALSNKEYLSAFQSINKAIQNPVFFISFMGSLIVMPIACYLDYKNGHGHLLPYLLFATIIYTLGVFGITIACNVPLNDMLDGFNIQSATASQLHEMRVKFETGWNKWHLIRTIAAIVSFVILIIPLIKRI